MPPTFRFPRFATRDEIDEYAGMTPAEVIRKRVDEDILESFVNLAPTPIDAHDVYIEPIYRVDKSGLINTRGLALLPGRLIGVTNAPDEPTEDARGADGADELAGGLNEEGPTP